MDWLALQARMPRDASMPRRSARLAALEAVLEGRQYDVLPYAFSKERSDAGEYVPLDERRPSVRTGLCRVVVEDSVSLLFSEGHWPSVTATDSKTATALSELIRETRLNEIMLEAATRGSVGSVAIQLRIIERRPYFEVLSTKYLTPVWRSDKPRELLSVTECFKVAAADLVAQGYAVDLGSGPYWFKRVWDDTAERWFLPVPVGVNPSLMPPDPGRTVLHGLEFVPIVWIRNISGSGGHDPDGPDGTCTFAASIDTVIEADYLLSQAGRGLKYGSDPTLVLKDPSGGLNLGGAVRSGGAASALTLPPEGDAKLLEINGNAAAAVLAHVQELRAIALEAMHGNRAHGDRMGAAQSGRAIELMCQGLIWLADRLRISYGDAGLLALMSMLCKASNCIAGGLEVAGGAAENLDAGGLKLVWPSWFPASFADRQAQASSVVTLLGAGVIDHTQALAIVTPLYGLGGTGPPVEVGTDV
ncbi:portal protein [Lichenicola sp.]|uniref:portal protein n=1 Tax=Lichenicola sp. TaxID=2804529 RepID=UPI003AFF69CD